MSKAGMFLLTHQGQTQPSVSTALVLTAPHTPHPPHGEGSRDMVPVPWGPAGSLLGASERAGCAIAGDFPHFSEPGRPTPKLFPQRL